MIRLIAADMDGTLLDSSKSLPPDFPEVFARLREMGVVFVAASGRFYPKQRAVFADYLDALPKEKLHRLLRACAGIPDVMPILCAAETCYYQPVSERFIPNFTSYFNNGRVTEDLFSVQEDIMKVAICDLAGSAHNAYPVLSRALGEELNIVVSGEFWLDAMNPDTNKGAALDFLQQSLGVTSAQTMAFGDYYNDIELLARAEYSFVMENANEDMRRYGRFLAESNDRYGVTRAIRRLLFSTNTNCISQENVLQ